MLISSTSGLHIEEWGENAVVYHSLSGDTHYLNGLAVEILKLIREQPVPLKTLVEEICATFIIEDKTEIEQQIKQLLSQFSILGLVESLSCED